MKLQTMTSGNGNTHCKSYKTVANAKKVLAKIEEEIKECTGTLTYVIAVNDEGRFYLQFMMDHAHTNLSFHWLINQGHCVVVR